MAGARPEPHRDADKILTRVDAVTKGLENLSRVQTRAAEKQTEIARRTEVESHGPSAAQKIARHAPTALRAASLASDAYKLAKWTDPLGGAAGLGTAAIEKATGHDSLTSNVARQGSFILEGAQAMAGHPVAMAKTAVALPQQLKDTVSLPFAGVKSAVNTVKERTAFAKSGFGEMAAATGGFGLTKDFGPDSGAKQLEHMGRSSEKFLQAGMGKYAGKAASFAVGPPVLFAKLAGRLQEFGDHLQNVNNRFVEFSGAMAAVNAKQEIRDIQLSQQRGDRLAPSADYMNEKKSKLDSSMAKIEDSMGTMKNLASGQLMEVLDFFVGPFAEGFSQVVDGIVNIAKLFGLAVKKKEEEDNDDDLEGWLEETTKKRWLEDYGRPQRFRD